MDFDDTDLSPDPVAADHDTESMIVTILGEQNAIVRAAQEFIEHRADAGMQSVVKEFRDVATSYRGRKRFDDAYVAAITTIWVQKIVAFTDLYAAKAELMSFQAQTDKNVEADDELDSLASAIEEHVDITLSLLSQNDDGTAATRPNRTLMNHVRMRAQELSDMQTLGVTCPRPADMLERLEMHNDLHTRLCRALRQCVAVVLQEIKNDLGYYGVVYDTGDTPRHTMTDNSPVAPRAEFTTRDLLRNLAVYNKLSESWHKTAGALRPVYQHGGQTQRPQ